MKYWFDIGEAISDNDREFIDNFMSDMRNDEENALKMLRNGFNSYNKARAVEKYAEAIKIAVLFLEDITDR